MVLPAIKGLDKVDFIIQQDVREMQRQKRALDIVPVDLTGKEVDELVKFMEALNGKTKKRFGVPRTVPSGLSID